MCDLTQLKVFIVTTTKYEVSANCMSKTKMIGFKTIQLQSEKKYCPPQVLHMPPKILVWLRAWEEERKIFVLKKFEN